MTGRLERVRTGGAHGYCAGSSRVRADGSGAPSRMVAPQRSRKVLRKRGGKRRKTTGLVGKGEGLGLLGGAGFSFVWIFQKILGDVLLQEV